MAAFELDEWIDATPETVFAFMTDLAKAPELLESVQRMEKLTEGPLRRGSRLRETRLMNGREAVAELVIEAYQPPDKYVVSAEQNGITVIYSYTLQPENEGTRARLQADIRTDGLKKLMLPLVASIMKREDGDHLRQLKTAVEAGTA